MPEEVNEVRPHSKKSRTSEREEENLKISVHCGPNQDMISMATIEMEDINNLVSCRDVTRQA